MATYIPVIKKYFTSMHVVLWKKCYQHCQEPSSNSRHLTLKYKNKIPFRKPSPFVCPSICWIKCWENLNRSSPVIVERAERSARLVKQSQTGLNFQHRFKISLNFTRSPLSQGRKTLLHAGKFIFIVDVTPVSAKIILAVFALEI